MRFGKYFFGFQILICFGICDCFSNTFNEAEERTAIVQFFNYVDEIYNYNTLGIVDLLLEFFRNLYNGVPEDKRGAAAAEVKNFIDNLESEKRTGDTYKMKNAAADFDNIEEVLLIKSMDGQQEKIIVRQDYLQMIIMLKRMAEFSESFLRKLNHAADALNAKFTDEGFGRHEKLFALLTELKNVKITEGHRPDELLEQLNELKADYMG